MKPNKKTKVIAVRLTEADFKRITKQALKEQRSVSNLYQKMINYYFQCLK